MKRNFLNINNFGFKKKLKNLLQNLNLATSACRFDVADYYSGAVPFWCFNLILIKLFYDEK